MGQFLGFIGQRQNKTRVMINLTLIPEALIPLNGNGDPDLLLGSGITIVVAENDTPIWL